MEAITAFSISADLTGGTKRFDGVKKIPAATEALSLNACVCAV